MEVKSNKLLYLRTFSLFCVFMAIPIAFLQTYHGEFSYLNLGNVNKHDIDGLIKQFEYFTIWSNILAMFWVALAFIGELYDIKAINNFVERPSVKLTPLIMMSITMVVSFVILYPFAFVGLLKNSSTEDAVKSIFGTMFLTPLLFQHLLVAVVLIIDISMTKGYRTKNNEKESFKVNFMALLCSALIPLIWLVISISLIETGFIGPQYPFMAIFSPDYDISLLGTILSWLTLVMIFVSWILVWYLISYLTNRKFKEAK